MADIVLEAEKREIKTKGFVHALRRDGKVPAVTYGDGEAPQTLTVNEKALQKAIHSERGRNAIITLNVTGGGSHAVLVKAIDRHPITRAIRHVDLFRISLKKKIEAPVPLHVKGEAPGVKIGGGIVEHIVREIRVRCLPMDIPNEIILDISTLQIGEGIRPKQLVMSEGVELLIDKEAILLHIVAPAAIEEPTPAAGAAVAGATSSEPEVIKKGKPEEGADAAATGDKKAPAGGDKKAAAPAAKTDKK